VVFHAATGLDANTIASVQAGVRRRLLRVFVRRGLLPAEDAQAMGQWQHGGGFSVGGRDAYRGSRARHPASFHVEESAPTPSRGASRIFARVRG
jgi:hypothetical protein